VLRRALLSENHFDVEQWEQRVGELLRTRPAVESTDQNELFE